jgi:hypothetical protein
MKAIGIINIVLGGLYIIMNALGLLIIYIEKLVFSSLNDFSYSEFSYNEFMPFDMNAYMSDLFNIMLFSVPVSIIAYGILLLGGIKILKKNETGIRMIKASSWIIIAWFIAYMVYFYLTMTPYFEAMAGGMFVSVMFIIGGIIGFVFTCGYPIFLLIYFSKPRQFK